MSSFADSLEVWLKNNCLSEVRHKGSIPRCSLFLFAVWNLWKNKNKVVFENSIPSPTLDKACLDQAKEYYYCVIKAKQVASRVVIPIKWSNPLPGWHKLNIDGASLGNPGKAGGGGLIRNNEGGWIRGYSRSIGYTISVMAELWALRDGLTLATQLGIRYLEVELDAKVIVEMLNNVDSSKKFSPLLLDCKSPIASLTQVRVAHVFREANRCANFLAKKGYCMWEDFVIFDASPFDELDQLLVSDINGLYSYRQVATTLASVASL